jgi:hypothetical protein
VGITYILIKRKYNSMHSLIKNGFKTPRLFLKEGHSVRKCKNKFQRKVFGFKLVKITGIWRKLKSLKASQFQ